MADDDTSSRVIAFSGNTMVYESVKRFSIKALNELMRGLMENVDDALFDFAKKAETDNERNLYFEAMRDLRLKRKNLEADFDSGIKARFDALITNQPLKANSAADDELSLVDQSEVEDRLAIDNMIAKALPHFEDDLYAVDERLKVVLHRRKIAKEQNPLNPLAICESFHDASEQLDVDIRAKLVFYKLFDQQVLAKLGEFYRQLNDFFVQKGVLPQFQAAEERFKQTTRFMADLRQRDRERDDPDSTRRADPSKLGPGAGSKTSASIDDGGVLNLLRQAISGLAPVVDGEAAGSAGGGGMTGPGGGVGSGGGAPAGLVAGGGVGMVTALTGLQAAPINSQPLMSVEPSAMKAQLATQMADFRASNPANNAEKQAIDMVSMLFDFFFEDRALPDPVKVLIGRLQIPILKVALLDEGFFNSRKHPARRLLDLISRVALGWSRDPAEQQPLVDRLEGLVERLLQDFEDDVATFEVAVNDLQAFIDDEKQRVEHNVAEIEQQEQQREQRIRQAERQVDELLDSLEQDRHFSLAVIDFLRGVWRKVLFDTLVSEGEDSHHWHSLKRISSTLVWTLVPRRSEKGRLKLLKTLPHLLKALSKGMQLVHIDEPQQEQVFQVLVHEHANVVKQTARYIAEQSKQDEQASPATPAVADNDGQGSDPLDEVGQQPVGDVIHNLEEFTDSIVNGNIRIDEEIVMDSAPLEAGFGPAQDVDQDDFVEQARALELGSWIEFDEQDGESLHARLSWKSNVTGKYVFVDRFGNKVRTLTVFGYAAELRAGRAREISQLSFFDRAVNSLVAGIRKA